MNLMQTILKAGGGAIVKQLGQNLGLNNVDTQSAIAKLLPALSQGLQKSLQKNTPSGGGLEAIIGALTKSNSEQYLQTERLNTETPEGDPVKDGNSILNAIFGSKDVSKNVAGHAAEESGIDPSILRKMLPVLAILVIAFLKQRAAQDTSTSESGISSLIKSLQSGGKASGDQLSGLAAFLDADKDGSVMDEVLGMARKFF